MAVALGFILTTIILTHILGPKRKSKIKDETFECGIEVQGNAKVPFSIKYFMTAILFVLFDVRSFSFILMQLILNISAYMVFLP